MCLITVMFQSVTPRPGKIAFQVDPFPASNWQDEKESLPAPVAKLELLAAPEPEEPAAAAVKEEGEEALTPVSPARQPELELVEKEETVVAQEKIPQNVTSWEPPKKSAVLAKKRGGKRFGAFFGQ